MATNKLTKTKHCSYEHGRSPQNNLTIGFACHQILNWGTDTIYGRQPCNSIQPGRRIQKLIYDPNLLCSPSIEQSDDDVAVRAGAKVDYHRGSPKHHTLEWACSMALQFGRWDSQTWRPCPSNAACVCPFYYSRRPETWRHPPCPLGLTTFVAAPPDAFHEAAPLYQAAVGSSSTVKIRRFGTCAQASFGLHGES